MKKNAALFVVLVLLLLGTYFFQEKRSETEYQRSLVEGRLLEKELVHLKLPKVEALRKKNQWFSGDQLLSHNSMKLIEEKLLQVKKVKEVSGDWKAFFPHPFQIQVNHEDWTFGDLALDRQSFYVGVKDKIYLAIIDGPSSGVTQDENEIEAMKLNELMTFLSKDLRELKEVQLFRFYPDLPLKRVAFEIDGNLPFELDLESNKTSPPPIQGIEAHKDLRGKFFSLLTQMTLKEEVPFSEKLKFKKLGSLSFLAGPEEVRWELWIRSEKSADAYILDPKQKRAFLMVGGTLKVFFVHLQDYWDKKVIPAKDFETFSKLTVRFTQGEKSADVTIYNREPLSFEARGFNVDTPKMDFLFQFLFNLGHKDQAERVSLLSKSERRQVLSENHLRLEVMNQELLLWRKAQELIVVNLTKCYKAHFNLVDENFRATFEDVLK
jgi:hypothetical protein